MRRDKLVRECEKETGNKFNVECVVYNDYAEWLETKLSERQTTTEAKSKEDSKALHIGDVINCPLCGGEMAFAHPENCMTEGCPNCVF